MSYATTQDLIERYGAEELIQLTDRNVPAQAIDDTAVTRALADADSTINGYLAARYTLPLASVAPLIVRLACEIARYMLYDDAAPERVKNAHDAAIKTLEGIAKGAVSLGLDAAGASPVPASGGAPIFDDTERTFTRDTLVDY